VNEQYEREKLDKRQQETNASTSPGTKECVGTILTAGFFGFCGGVLAKAVIGGLLVAAGVAAATALTVSIVGAVIVGVIIIAGIVYYVYKD